MCETNSDNDVFKAYLKSIVFNILLEVGREGRESGGMGPG